MRGLAFEITRELLEAGRHPVWFDVDPTKGDLWHVDGEMFQGHAEAIKQFDKKSGSLYLCPIEPDRIEKVAETVCRAGLTGAAAVFCHWASAMVPPVLATHSRSPHDLLIVPIPNGWLSQSLRAPNVVQWSRNLEVEEIAQQAVDSLVPVLEGKSEQLKSTTLEMSCKFVPQPPRGLMELTTRWEAKDAFTVYRLGSGHGWRHRRREAGGDVSGSETETSAPSKVVLAGKPK